VFRQELAGRLRVLQWVTMRQHSTCPFRSLASLQKLRGGVPQAGTMKILEAKFASDGTLQGFAVSRRGRRYRWFVWSNGALSVFREEEQSLWPGATHWSSLWGHLSEFPVRAAIRAALTKLSGTEQPALI
jgi:hypothetical protein